MSNKPTKPLLLEFAEAKNEIASAINNAMQKHGIPCSLLEDVLTNHLLQIKAGARGERESAALLYEKHLAEYEKKEAGEAHDGS